MVRATCVWGAARHSGPRSEDASVALAGYEQQDMNETWDILREKSKPFMLAE